MTPVATPVTKAATEIQDVPHMFNQHANICPIMVPTPTAVANQQDVKLIEFRILEIMASLPDLNLTSNPR